jgi:internalin A
MPKKILRTKAVRRKQTLTPEQVAERRIKRWSNLSRGTRFPLGSVTPVLNLSEIRLRTVPEGLRGLHSVELLDLSSNDIEVVPAWFGELSALRGLLLNNNEIETLPDSFGSLQKLTTLDLSENRLTKLPRAILRCPLSYLELHGNESLELPESMLFVTDPRRTLQYYFSSRGDKGTPLQELKLVLVGRGKAGKTTLVKRLAGEKPNKKEEETHSIAIRTLALDCPKGTVRARAWDFGGQEILHSTHQFFLTERSLYLIVLEPRTGLAQRDAEYWLKLIEAQGGGSPAIVVMNWSHERPWRVDEVKLKRKFPFIVAFLSTDALYGDGITELKQTIIETVDKQMPDVWFPFPRRWRSIESAVAQMQDNFLTYHEYTALCETKGETDPEAQTALAETLHALGLALYFGKDPRLHDTRVLNPGWVTGGVYAVIRSRWVAQHDGQLNVRDMPRVLREAQKQKVIKVTDYPSKTHTFILELMRAFQLCFANEQEKQEPDQPATAYRYLVPELLSDFEPALDEPWDTATIRLRYRYDVLPPGLVPRFIVQTHELSDGEPHWRHGVVLRHGEAKALIREDADRQELDVFVLAGDDETRRVLVAMVRRELEMVNRSMKAHPIEEIELTDEKEQWISVKALRDVETRGAKRQKLPVQPDGTADVNVPHELNKLTTRESRVIDRNPKRAPWPVRVFVSYAHDDEPRLKRLDLMLDVLEQQHGLSPWRDKRLIAGDEWDAEIRRRLAEMDIFLFVASATSLVRPYIRDPELKLAKQRHAKGEIELVSVRLEPCACDDDDFLGKLQRLAPMHKSIAESKLKSGAWENVRLDLLNVIKRVREKKSTRGNK